MSHYPVRGNSPPASLVEQCALRDDFRTLAAVKTRGGCQAHTKNLGREENSRAGVQVYLKTPSVKSKLLGYDLTG